MEKDKSLLEMIEARLADNRNILPAFNINALRIQREASKEDPDIRMIEKLIVQDQALTSQVLKMANSAFYKGLSKVRTIKAAIVRLGTREIANLVLLVSQKSSFHAKNPFYQKVMDQLWIHSIGCAVGSHWLSKNCGLGEVSYEAFFAGLLHDIGKLLVISVIKDIKKSGEIDQDPPQPFLEEIMHTLHTEQGAALMKAWNLPGKYAVIVRDHHLDKYDTKNRLLSIVRLANTACHKMGIGTEPFPELLLTVTPEAEILGLSEIDLAQLEVKLEDAVVLASG